MGVGALVGAFLFGGAALFAGGELWLLGVSLGLWQAVMLGMSLGSLFDAPSFNAQSPTYSLNPIGNTTSQILPVPVVYGRVRVAGNVFYQQFEDDTKQIMYQHVGLSEGPIKSVGTSDVMINDVTTAELSTVTKEVFLGTADQAASVNDPEGMRYPYTAYVSLKMEASEKLRGTPVVTTVLNGRDIDYPGKGDSQVYMQGAIEAASGNFIDEAEESNGYKSGTVYVDGVGYAWVYDDDLGYYVPSKRGDMAFQLNAITDASKDQIFCIPWVFRFKEIEDGFGLEWTVNFDVYPDKDSATYYRLSYAPPDGGVNDFSVALSNGVKVHFEVRATGGEVLPYYAGVLYFRLPGSLVPAAGTIGKIVVTLPYAHYATRSEPRTLPAPIIAGGLLPYTDILTDNPWGGFESVGFNSPAWCAYDYLTNTRYGAGIPEAFFDTDSFAEVAGQCGAEGITLNLAVDAQRPTVDVLKDILAPARAFLVARDKIRLKMDALVSVPQKTVTANDIIEGSFSYGMTPADQIPNRVTVEYVDGDEDSPDGCTWERTNYTVEDWDDIMARGVYERRLSMMGITHKAQAKAMANFLYEQARRCRVFCSFATSLKNAGIEVGDVVAITFDLPGWVEKWMRVIGVEDDSEGRISVTCLEYDPAIYDTSDDL